jgi:hypothetical protein
MQGIYVQKLHLCLYVSMQIIMVHENDISLTIFYTYIGAQGTEYICEIWYDLVPFLLHCGPSCIQVIITSTGVVLFRNSIRKRMSGECEFK